LYGKVGQGIFALGLASGGFALDRPTGDVGEVSDIHVCLLRLAVALGLSIVRIWSGSDYGGSIGFGGCLGGHG